MKKHSGIGLFFYGLLTLITFIGAFILVNDNIVYKKPDVIFPEDVIGNSMIPNVVGFSDNDLVTKKEEIKNFTRRYDLPDLQRFNKQDQELYIDNLLMTQKIETLGISIDLALLPEKRWKALYNESLVSLPEMEEIIFEGTKASELNVFINNNLSKFIIVSNDIVVDETIILKSNTYLKGNKKIPRIKRI